MNAPRSILRADVEYADASMLLRHLRESADRSGGVNPLTVRDALEAIHRKQGATIIPLEAAHITTVLERLDMACSVANLPRLSPCIGDAARAPCWVEPARLDDVSRALEALPHVPIRDMKLESNA